MRFVCVTAVPSVGVTPAERGEKGELARALAVTHKATASMGKFTGQLANEKPLKNVGKRRTVRWRSRLKIRDYSTSYRTKSVCS